MNRLALAILFVCVGATLCRRLFTPWPNQPISYEIHSSLSSAGFVIRDALKSIEKNVNCIKFQEKSSGARIIYKMGRVCTARGIGYRGRNVEVTLSRPCLKGSNTAAFETSIALGIYQKPVGVGTPLTDQDYADLRKLYKC